MRKMTWITNPTKLNQDEIKLKLSKRELVHVQFYDNSYSDGLLQEINTLCSEHEENLVIRFYGMEKNFDLEILNKIKEVKSLAIDHLKSVKNFHVLSTLKNLKYLIIGIHELKDKEFLRYENLRQLHELYLYPNKQKNVNLEYLQNYDCLHKLTLFDQNKNIQYVGKVKNLKHLHLKSIKNVSLEFISDLKNLVSLELVLGGRENINEVKNENLESLEFCRVRRFNEVGDLSRFPNLKRLRIIQQKQIKKIVFEQRHSNLKSLHAFECKTLYSLEGLKNLSALEWIGLHYHVLDFESFYKQEMPEKLKFIIFQAKTKSKQAEINGILEKGGFQTS